VVVAAEIVRRPRARGYGLVIISPESWATSSAHRGRGAQTRFSSPTSCSASMATAPRLKTAKVPCDRPFRYVLAGHTPMEGRSVTIQPRCGAYCRADSCSASI
jgi:hypothetical protein